MATLPRPSIVLLHGVQSSRTTWWRLAEDLTDLGWDVSALDLPGHGDRAALADHPLTIEGLARDVAAQVPGPVDLLVGHSLGAIVALTLARLAPSYAARLVVEDPPGLAGPLDPDDVATEVERAVDAARTDPLATVAGLLEQPRWSRADAENAVRSRRLLNVERVTQLLRASRWDLPSLVRGCPIPVHLLAATTDSALTEPDRSAVLEALPADRIAILASGHSIHRDRPALWLRHVLAFADP